MIVLKNVTKEFADHDLVTPALRGVSFTIEPGEFIAIMGPSGSGKSTLLHILGFLDRPTAGEYVFFGNRIYELTDTDLAAVRNQKMGFVFQAFHLLGRASVYDNVELPLLYSTLPPAERQKKVEAAVAAVGLSDKLRVEAGKLSGGQKQRVAIARALVNDPEVLFADEPTGNLDSASGAQVMEILETLHQKGKTIIVVTHETYTAGCARRILKVRDGRIESDERNHRELGNNTFFK